MMIRRVTPILGALIFTSGIILMVLSGSRLLSSGIAADTSGTSGTVSMFDVAFGVGGLIAVFAGVMIVGYSLMATRASHSSSG